MSKKILDLARDQQEEIARELGEEEWEDDEDEEERGEPSVAQHAPCNQLIAQIHASSSDSYG
jgi:hypothetical protein